MDEERRDIIPKSPTGSGKTIILAHFMDEYMKSRAKTVFIWLTPGKGDLEEQSEELCICTDEYGDDVHSDAWRLCSSITEIEKVV